ncbi:MAG TPA: SDR family oxidoreductase [Tepidisphaeraceae bacterium]|jgi:nucleoside-diphosphate-sugar epimerase|nr:SDR family oxidoreductase [Tepidisphaeraceae bacterium]
MAQSVFLTGATGALGPILAAELLASGAASRLNVLIRSSDCPASHRFDRWIETLESVLAASGSLLPTPRRRVGLVDGDLCADHLGLSEAQRDALIEETEVIIHAAADTNFRGKGQTHWETNVQGTQRLLDLAGRCKRLRKIIFVSTICSAGIQTGLIREEPILEKPTFANAYERTKWEAEQVVLASDLPVEIVRVGIVIGSSITGAVYRLGAFHHVMKWFGGGQMPVVPGRPDTPVDLIDAELAAKLIRKATTSPSKPGSIYHAAAGKRAVLLGDLFQFSSQQLLDDREYDSSLLGQKEDHSPAHARLAKAWLPVLLASRTYDTTQAEALWGGPLPLADWRETLAKMLTFCGYKESEQASVG